MKVSATLPGPCLALFLKKVCSISSEKITQNSNELNVSNLSDTKDKHPFFCQHPLARLKWNVDLEDWYSFSICTQNNYTLKKKDLEIDNFKVVVPLSLHSVYTLL